MTDRPHFLPSSALGGVTDPRGPLVFLPGAGGTIGSLSVFKAGPDDDTDIELIAYPGWQRYAAAGYSAEILVDDLVNQIDAKAPHGPIRMAGLSLGGHFAYATALRLQAKGREVAGVCLIDAFMIESSGPSEKWRGKALSEFLELFRKLDGNGILEFIRSRFWRLLLRLAGGRLPSLVKRFASNRIVASIVASDPILKGELTMRLLIHEIAPWLASLDQAPRSLNAPAILLRTGLTVSDDEAWRRRCPNIKIYEIPGNHHSLFAPENLEAFRDAFVRATEDWR